MHKFNAILLAVEKRCRLPFSHQNHAGECPMRVWSLMVRVTALVFCAALVTACEGPNWQKDNAGGSIRLDDWQPIETSQLGGNLATVFSDMPLKDAKRTMRDNAVIHDVVTITDRGWANAQRMIAPYSYFGEHAFSQLRSREAFETWVRGRFPQAKEVEIIEIIPVTHPTIATRGFAGTVMETNQQDRKFRCALAHAGYGGPRLSETATDIFRIEEFKSTLQIRFCTVGGTATSLNQRMQRVLF
ncbi:MAG: hypothetical protein ING08_06440 [Roseomonas sp.]|nr:hypothetical protein [Roseomonas sp.]